MFWMAKLKVYMVVLKKAGGISPASRNTQLLPITPFIQILAITQTSSHVVLFPISIYVLAAAQGLQFRFFRFVFLPWLHTALLGHDFHLSPRGIRSPQEVKWKEHNSYQAHPSLSLINHQRLRNQK